MTQPALDTPADTPKQSLPAKLIHFAIGLAKKVWAVPAVKRVALTWLISVLGATGAGVLVAIADSLIG